MRIIIYLFLIIWIFLVLNQEAWALEAFNRIAHRGDTDGILVSPRQKHFQKQTGFSVGVSSRKKIFTSPLTHLPVFADGQAALPSNANNFHGGWNASVDPRTGSASFSMKLDSTLYDYGRFKHDLSLGWSAGASAGGPDSFGLGANWHWNVGLEKPSTSEVKGHMTEDIVTGEGHGFTMVSQRNHYGQSVWRPLRHKLDDVSITGCPGNWTVSQANGIREHIKNGYEDWMEDRLGERIYFYYDRNGSQDTTRHLVYICEHKIESGEINLQQNACSGHGLWITYQNQTVTVHGVYTAVLHERQITGHKQVVSLTLPSLTVIHGKNSGTSNINFSYDNQGNRPWLLSQVTYPNGASTTFLYDDESEKPAFRTPGLPAGMNGGFIPVVTEQVTHSPDKSVPDKRVWYRYGRDGNDLHNYTGYQGNGIMIPGRDNLMDRPDSYAYSVVMDNGATRTTTTYNKYHLPLSVVQQSDTSDMLIGKSEKCYPAWKHTVFDELPSDYSFARQTIKTIYAVNERGNTSVKEAKVIKAARYDSRGQAVWRRDAWGRETFIQYCPEQGDRHCPAMDPAWPVINRPEKILVIPAGHSPSGSAPFLVMPSEPSETAQEVVFDYGRLPATRQDKKNVYGSFVIDKSSTSFSWQVKDKNTGSVDLETLKDLKPGDVLPELYDNKIHTQTEYGYDMNPASASYGEINHVEMIRHKPLPPKVAGHFLVLAKPAVMPSPSERLSVDIIRHIDLAKGISTLSTKVLPFSARSIKRDKGEVLINGQGINFGKTVYSLKTGNKLSAADKDNSMNVKWVYDFWSRPIKKVVTLRSGGKPHIITWDYIVNPNETSVIETDTLGAQKKTVLSVDGHVLSTWHRYGTQGRGAVASSARWIPDTSMVYTRTGKVASETVWHAADPVKGKKGKAIALTTYYGYDSLNRNTWAKGPDGLVSVKVRDDPSMRLIQYRLASGTGGGGKARFGPVINVVQSNILGKAVASYIFPLDPMVRKKGRFLYSSALRNKLNALKAAMLPLNSLHTLNSYGLLPLAGSHGLFDFVQSAINAGEWLTETTFAYDGFGRMIRKTTGNGATTRWHWQDNNLVATEMPDGRIIHDTFNLQGEKVSRCVQAPGSNICHMLGTRGYDSEGNLLWQADETGNVVRYTYDSIGRRLSMVTSDGHVIRRQYNSIGPVEVDIDGKPVARYKYDPDTWRITDREDPVSHIHYDYDKNTGWLVTVTHSRPQSFSPPSGVEYPTGTESVNRNRYGRVVSSIDLFGNRHENKYDKLGRLVRSEVWPPGAKSPVLLESVTRDDFGRTVTVTRGNGTIRTIHYNSLGWVESTTDSVSKHREVLRLGYTYDPDTSNILTVTRKENGISAVQTYDYDKKGNLADMRCHSADKSGDGSGLCPREMNLEGSDLDKPPVITSQHYSFDRWNNIDTVTEKLIVPGHKEGNETRTVRYFYAGEKTDNKTPQTYDPHRMIAYDIQWSGQRYTLTPHSLTYDRQGRVAVDGNGNHLTYNALGQQVAFTNAHTKNVTRYYYDSLGHQAVEQQFDNHFKAINSPLYMIYNGNTITGQAQKDNRGHMHHSTEFSGIAHGEDGVVCRWYLDNYKGDILDVLNNQGQRVQGYTYSPYGMRFGFMSTLDTLRPWWRSHTPGFDGEMSDPVTGYQFLGGGYRAYNPIYRHFMAGDSYSPFIKMNGYGFVSNNPVMNTDPTGHSKSWFGYLMGSVGIAMSLVTSALIPVAVAATVPILAGTYVGAGLLTGMGGSAVVGAVLGSVGVASGSLQIATTAHPHNRNLAIVSQAFGVASGIMDIVLGAVDGLSSIPLSLTIDGGSKTVRRVLFAGIIGSSIASVGSGMTGATASGMGLAALNDSSLAGNRNFFQAINIIADINLGLMAVSSLAMAYSLSHLALKGINRWENRGTLRYIRDFMFNKETESFHESSSKRSVSPFRYLDTEEVEGSFDSSGRRERGHFIPEKPVRNDGGQVRYKVTEDGRMLFISQHEKNGAPIPQFNVEGGDEQFGVLLLNYLEEKGTHENVGLLHRTRVQFIPGTQFELMTGLKTRTL